MFDGGVLKSSSVLLHTYSVFDVTIFYKDGSVESFSSWNEPTSFNGMLYVSPVSVERYMSGRGNIQRMIPVDGVRDVTYTREPLNK